jgi:signal transduction histidine kinase
MPFATIFTPEDRERGQPEHELRVAAETGEYKGEGRRVRKDGNLIEVAVVLTALRGPGGELLGFLKLTQDITARRAEERAREEALRASQVAQAEAERASHSKGEFLATLSHELRTPLSAILGWAQVLERGIFDADTLKHGLEAISRNAKMQVRLIEDLLDMTRIESGQLRRPSIQRCPGRRRAA